MSAAKDYFKKAEQAGKKTNFEYAIELYKAGLRLDPKAAQERRLLHHVMTLAIEEKGGNPQGGMGVKLKVMPILANCKKFVMQKKWDEAIQEYEKALQFQPQNSGTLFDLAKCLIQFECNKAAIVVLEDIVGNEKSHIEAYRGLAQQQAKQDDPEKAISYWEKVKQYKPDDKEAAKAIRDLSAATMVKKAEERKAETGDESFKAMLKDEDESAELEKKARIIRTDEDRVEAIKFKKEELRADPENSRLWRELGGFYQDLRQWKHAMAAYKKALEVNPHDLITQEKVGTLREAQSNARVDDLREKVKASGNGSSEHAEALAKAEQQHRLFLVQEYGRRVKAHPTDYELKMQYGRALMEAHRFDEAIEQFQKAVQDPKYKIPALNCNGLCFLKKDLHDLAEGQFLQALAEIADQSSEVGKEIKYNLATAYEQKAGKTTDDGAKETLVAKALERYQEIMAVDIGFRDVSVRVSALMNGGA